MRPPRAPPPDHRPRRTARRFCGADPAGSRFFLPETSPCRGHDLITVSQTSALGMSPAATFSALMGLRSRAPCGAAERELGALFMRTGSVARAIGVSSAVLLAVTACGGSDDNNSGGGDSGSSEDAVTNIYGSDGNMGSALGDQFTDQGALAGMKGTTPLTDLSADFKKRLD